MNKILVTGANGFLGQHLTKHLIKEGFDVIATGKGPSRLPSSVTTKYAEVDLLNPAEIEQLLSKYKPDVIIHNAALSKPDECEKDKDLCFKINVESTKHLLKGLGAKFIYVSTDFIFGENGPHAEDAETGPLNYYGETKLQSETLVKKSGKSYAIVRPVFIYGEAGNGMRPSFLHWVKNNLEQQKKIKVVSDQSRTPTYAVDICKGITTIINQDATGNYNLAGKDVLSPYDMAIATALVLNLDTNLIEKVTAETFPEPVKRAKRSGLRIDKAIAQLDYSPVSFEEGVRLTFAIDS